MKKGLNLTNTTTGQGLSHIHIKRNTPSREPFESLYYLIQMVLINVNLLSSNPFFLRYVKKTEMKTRYKKKLDRIASTLSTDSERTKSG